MDFLIENKILIPVNQNEIVEAFKKLPLEYDKLYPNATETFERNRATIIAHIIGLTEDIEREGKKSIEAFVSTTLRTHKIAEAWARILAPVVSKITGDEITPITESVNLPKDLEGRNEMVLSIILNQFPLVNENVSWKELIQFKNDAETQRKFLALRNWMIDITKSDYSQKEIQEKFEYLLADYNRHVEINNLKESFTKVELIFFGALDAISNLPELSLNKLIKPLIEFKKHQIRIMESELTAPGKEVAFIQHTNKNLNKL